jgi:hypothetical protein
MRFPGDVFVKRLFHGMGPPLLSSFKDLAGVMGKAAGIGIIVATVMAVAGWSAAASPETVGQMQAALDKGDAQHAADLADTALAAQGVSAAERARLLLYRGLARELLGAPDQAMGDLTKALDTHALSADERVQALLQRGFLRDGLGRLDEAAADYTAVIALKGEGLATALNNRANIYRRQNRLEQAQRDYRAALSAGGAKPQYAWYGLGQIAEARGDVTGARGFYARAVAADPGYALASQRLTALGGPPDAAADPPGGIVLQPLPPASAAVTTPTNGDGPITLHPPGHAVPDDNAPITLHPPGRVVLHPPSQPSRPSSQSHSRTAAVGPADLRPALDQTGHPAISARTGAEVQLGAWRSEAEARAGWEKAKAKAGGVLDGLALHIAIVDLPGKGRYYRLRTAPPVPANRTAFCADLTAKGVDCLPARD